MLRTGKREVQWPASISGQCRPERPRASLPGKASLALCKSIRAMDIPIGKLAELMSSLAIHSNGMTGGKPRIQPPFLSGADPMPTPALPPQHSSAPSSKSLPTSQTRSITHTFKELAQARSDILSALGSSTNWHTRLFPCP